MPCVSLMSALHGTPPPLGGFSTPSGPTVLRTATALRVSHERVRSGLRPMGILSEGAPRVSHEHVRSGLQPFNTVTKRQRKPILGSQNTFVRGFDPDTPSPRERRVSLMSTFLQSYRPELATPLATPRDSVPLSALEFKPRSEARYRSLHPWLRLGYSLALSRLSNSSLVLRLAIARCTLGFASGRVFLSRLSRV